METRALVDWSAELGLADRPVDDWTAGDDLDFTPRPPRRRITGAVEAPPVRRTIAITGHPERMREVPRLREIERRSRSTRGPMDRVASRPDRIAMWAVALGFVLILIASASS
jgi:hypothetical protein